MFGDYFFKIECLFLEEIHACMFWYCCIPKESVHVCMCVSAIDPINIAFTVGVLDFTLLRRRATGELCQRRDVI